jgi:hypothetical protein
MSMTKRQRIARLFTLKSRGEVWLVIYAIALGAVERGRVYLDTYPGFGGWLLALACTGVVFLAGAKLLDSVKPAERKLQPARTVPQRRHGSVSRSRPRARPRVPGARIPFSLRKD